MCMMTISIVLTFDVDIAANSGAIDELYAQTTSNIQEVDFKFRQGIFQIPVRTFDVTSQLTVSGSGSSQSVIILGRESLSKFSDGSQTLSNISMTQSFGQLEMSGGGLKVGSGRQLIARNVEFVFLKALVAGGAISSMSGDVMIESSSFFGGKE